MADFAKPRITQELKDTLNSTPNIKEVYFTGDGHHHFRAFRGPKDGLYTQLKEIPEQINGVYTNKSVNVPFMDGNQPDIRFTVVKTMSREEVLSANINATTLNEALLREPAAAKPQITKADILSMLEVSEEEFAAVLAASKAKKK